MSTFKNLTVTEGVLGDFKLEDKITKGFLDVFDYSLAIKEVPFTKMNSNYHTGDFSIYQIGRILLGFVGYYSTTPDYTELGRIYYEDLYLFRHAFKWHHLGIWISPQDDYISISLNFNYNDKNSLISFYTILYP